ncbi:MAG: hypothetical protein JWO82_4100 [Akkermansiaceae bacterium]|nr:hypothetical protein [Akkermansiaceae bacterium]
MMGVEVFLYLGIDPGFHPEVARVFFDVVVEEAVKGFEVVGDVVFPGHLLTGGLLAVRAAELPGDRGRGGEDEEAGEDEDFEAGKGGGPFHRDVGEPVVRLLVFIPGVKGAVTEVAASLLRWGKRGR